MKLTTRQKDALSHIAENCRKAAEVTAESTPEHDNVDETIFWRAVFTKLPPLLTQIEDILAASA